MLIADLWLVHRARRGDRRAFDALFKRHAPRVFNLLNRLCRNSATAEDLAQETFVTAYQSLAQWHARSAFSTWLCGIGINCYRRRCSGRTPEDEPLDDELAAPSDADPLSRYTRAEAWQALETAIARLPDVCREAFVLVYVEELSYKEAAGLLDVPIGTVQSRLNRAKRLLQVRLGPSVAEMPAADSMKGVNLHVL